MKAERSAPLPLQLASVAVLALLVGGTITFSPQTSARPLYFTNPSGGLASRILASRHQGVRRHWGRVRHNISYPTPIEHVVVIVMENRTVDNLFAGYYGAWPGLNLANPNGTPTLRRIEFETRWDPNHGHGAPTSAATPTPTPHGGFVAEYDNGAQDGWNNETFACPGGGCDPNPTALAYLDTNEVTEYQEMALLYGIADNVYQSNEGPSFPGHQYLIAGQSGDVLPGAQHLPYAESENARAPAAPTPTPTGTLLPNQYWDDEPNASSGGCDPPSSVDRWIGMNSPYPGIEDQQFYPCQDYNTVLDEIHCQSRLSE